MYMIGAVSTVHVSRRLAHCVCAVRVGLLSCHSTVAASGGSVAAGPAFASAVRGLPLPESELALALGSPASYAGLGHSPRFHSAYWPAGRTSIPVQL